MLRVVLIDAVRVGDRDAVAVELLLVDEVTGRMDRHSRVCRNFGVHVRRGVGVGEVRGV